jgi:hypothetical protein
MYGFLLLSVNVVKNWDEKLMVVEMTTFHYIHCWIKYKLSSCNDGHIQVNYFCVIFQMLIADTENVFRSV